MRRQGIDPRPHIPFTFVFRGPPGTGKTSTARKMGQLFYDMGLLSAPDLVECSASDLVSSYEGGTGHRVTDWLERALGKVLFIDEGYRLASGECELQAVEELLDRLTKTRYYRKLVVVLAGHGDEMLPRVNRSLQSRFEAEVVLRSLVGEACWQLLLRELTSVGIKVVEDKDGPQAVIIAFNKLANRRGWASARSVKQLSSAVIRRVFRDELVDGHAQIGTWKIFRELQLAELNMLVAEAESDVIELAQDDPQWSDAVASLATRLMQQHELTGAKRTLNRAIGCWEKALAATPLEDAEHAGRMGRLSLCLARRFE